MKVGDAKTLHETIGILRSLNKLLHGLPGLRDGDLGERSDLCLLLVGPEAGEANLIKGDELESDREMHQEEVDVAQTPSFIFQLRHLKSMFASMIIVPKLGGDEHIFALHNAFVDSSTDTLSSFSTVSIVPRTIDVTVAELDSVIDLRVEEFVSIWCK